MPVSLGLVGLVAAYRGVENIPELSARYGYFVVLAVLNRQLSAFGRQLFLA